MGNIVRMDPKLTSDVSSPSPPTPSSKSFFQNDRPDPPPSIKNVPGDYFYFFGTSSFNFWP